MSFEDRKDRRGPYHHGNLREALIQAALTLIAERGLAGFAIAELARAVGVSPAAPYRHFRDRDAVVAEVARRGFDGLSAVLRQAAEAGDADPQGALERCAQAHLAFAARKTAVYAAMFEPHFPVSAHPELSRARDDAFAVIRRAAQAAYGQWRGPVRPPPMMVALHVWSLTHGIAALFIGRDGGGASALPMPAADLLEAGLLIYLRSLADATRSPPA